MASSASGAPIRVLIVDDHGVVREGLRAYLELEPDIQVIGEARDGQEGVKRAEELHPDVVLMDLVMPRMDGVAATAAIKQGQPEAHVIVLTSFVDDDRVVPAIKAGATSYLLKDVAAADLARALVVSERTVKGHVSNILGKLGLQDRTQAALYAVRHGLAPEP